MTENWNQAITRGLGDSDLVSLLHQDDWYSPDCIRTVMEQFKKEPKLVMLAAASKIHRGNDKDHQGEPQTHKIEGVFSGKQYERLIWEWKVHPPPSIVFFRTAAINRLAPIYDSSFQYCSEVDLYLRLARAVPDGLFSHTPEFLVHRRDLEDKIGRVNRGYRARDTALLVLRERCKAENTMSGRFQASRHLIRSDVSWIIRNRNATQMRSALLSAVFLKWAIADRKNAGAVVSGIADGILRFVKVQVKKIKNPPCRLG